MSRFTYLCIQGYFSPGPTCMAEGANIGTNFAGRAITWIRHSVRSVAAHLDDQRARSTAAEWLDDLVSAGVAAEELRRGGYAYELHTETEGRWVWLATRVSSDAHPTAPGFAE